MIFNFSRRNKNDKWDILISVIDFSSSDVLFLIVFLSSSYEHLTNNYLSYISYLSRIFNTDGSIIDSNAIFISAFNYFSILNCSNLSSDCFNMLNDW
jgi:hypothetical protein